MADLTFPSITAMSVTLDYRRNSLRQSSMSGKFVNVDRTGDRYIATVNMPPLQGSDAHVFRAFLMRASDVANEVILPIMGYESPTDAGLSLLVNGASQTGSTLNCDGASTTTIKAGTIGSTTTYELIDVATDAAPTAGAVALSLQRPLRSSPADNSAVDIYTPKGLFLMPESVVRWAISAPLTYAFSFQMEEAL